MEYSDKDLEALISEVETEFASHLTKAEDKETEVLAKSEEVEAKVEGKEEETQELAKNEDEETLNYDDEDMKEMNELYASMSKSEKEAHYKAIKTVLFDGSEESEEGTKIAKSEDQEQNEENSEDNSVLAKNELLEKENEELKKSVSKLVTILTDKVKSGSAPKQKAITGIEYMKKSEEEVEVTENETDISKLSKAEITARLNEKARSEKLEKSDRERINAFVFNEIGIDKIKDLL